MMRRFDLRIAWGVFLMAAGVLALLQNFNVLTGALNLLWAFLLGLAGVFFLYTYVSNRANWWAIIPGGVLVTLAVVASMETVFQRTEQRIQTGGIFFIGLGLTFALVGLLPAPRGRMRWAFIPALVLLLMGLLVFAAAEQLINYLWPLALILAGLYLVFRTFRPRPSE